MAKKRKLESTGEDRSELRALLSAAKADHWDDGPRLAIADWLEEHGDEADRARAEVIRLQLDEARGGPAWALTVEKLRQKHVREWAGAHRTLFARKLPTCERGLLMAEASAAWSEGEKPCDEAWDWVESASASSLDADSAPRLLASPRLASVPRFRFGGSWTGQGVGLTVSACADRFLALDLTTNAQNLRVLGRALRPGLRELSLGIWGNLRRDLGALFSSEAAQGLRGLSLQGSRLDDEGAARLAGSPGLRGLQRLEADSSVLELAGLASLAKLPLRRLALAGTPFGLSALPLLADGGCSDTLEELRLWSHTSSGDRTALPRLGLPRLRRLALNYCRVGPTAAAALAGAADLGRLDELDLTGNLLRPGGIAALGADGPRTLRLADCQLGDEGAARLAAWPGLARVRHLDLAWNGIGNEGLRILADSPHVSALEALRLDGNGRIVGKGVAWLLRSPLAERLRWLSLDYAASPVAVAKAFQARRPSALRELRLGWHAMQSIGNEGKIRLRAALPQCAIG